MLPILIKGNIHSDNRGSLKYNNDFNLSQVKRIYIIENNKNDIKRGWQGHKIEQRWFTAIQGSFKIQLIAIDNWEKPSETLSRLDYILESATLDVLHIPAGYVSSIQALEEKSKLLVMSDYYLGEINDEFRYPTDYFTIG
jgi:dTDP-4-dehydrorhamnose 3,5-epimerase-like enzyme